MIKQVMVNSSAGTSCSDQNLFRRLVLDNQKGFVGNQWHPAPIKNDSSPTAVAATGKCKSIPAIFFSRFFFFCSAWVFVSRFIGQASHSVRPGQIQDRPDMRMGPVDGIMWGSMQGFPGMGV